MGKSSYIGFAFLLGAVSLDGDGLHATWPISLAGFLGQHQQSPQFSSLREFLLQTIQLEKD